MSHTINPPSQVRLYGEHDSCDMQSFPSSSFTLSESKTLPVSKSDARSMSEQIERANSANFDGMAIAGVSADQRS
jgi:hypothetical protein